MIKLAPSILSADFANLERDIGEVMNAGAHYLHIDVMDGMFVPNITIGPPVVKSLRKVSDAVFDVHLMINEPIRYIKNFADAGADIITVHTEACSELLKTILEIKENGKRAGVSIKPKTPIEAVFPVIDQLDLILVMSVEPGFGGQKLIDDTLLKARALKRHISENGFKAELEIDGGINLQNVSSVLEYGLDVIVAGEAVFGTGNRELAVKSFLSSFEEFGNR